MIRQAGAPEPALPPGAPNHPASAGQGGYEDADFDEAADFREAAASFTLLRASVIQAGGLPRLLPRPRASRSRLMMASSICSRSWRNSARILVTSMVDSV